MAIHNHYWEILLIIIILNKSFQINVSIEIGKKEFIIEIVLKWGMLLYDLFIPL